MNPDLDIRIEGLGKRYRLGHSLQLNQSFREVLMSIPQLMGRTPHGATSEATTESGNGEYGVDTPPGTFWALRDINLEVKKGEVVGIIGRNGAGKSTLLKILSRVTSPTTGRAEIRGRVGALLEVGTGFHPELTGRENVYLNGAILGMRRTEIDRKFDEIVSFAEVEPFLDTPVKRYSNGMRVRLGFAVAAHLDPEILIIDEVLSVGDAAFRKKCIEKMRSVARDGRTVLFISHHMGSIRTLCHRALLLDRGRVIEDGPSTHVIESYLGEHAQGIARREWDASREPVPGSDTARLISAQLVSAEDGTSRDRFTTREAIDLEIEYRVDRPAPLFAEFHVKDAEGQRLFVAGEFQDMKREAQVKEPGRYRTVCHLPANFFNEGTHTIDIDLVSLNPARLHGSAVDALILNLHDDQELGGSRGFRIRADWPPSVIRPLLTYDLYRDGEPQ